MSARIKKGDVVMVICGDDKGKQGRVLRVLPKTDRILIEGVNRVYRHVKRSQKNPQGGRLEKEAAIHISNVQPMVSGRATRVGFQKQSDGLKHRIARGNHPRAGTSLGVVAGKAKQ